MSYHYFKIFVVVCIVVVIDVTICVDDDVSPAADANTNENAIESATTAAPLITVAPSPTSTTSLNETHNNTNHTQNDTASSHNINTNSDAILDPAHTTEVEATQTTTEVEETESTHDPHMISGQIDPAVFETHHHSNDNASTGIWTSIGLIVLFICGCICIERLYSSCKKVYLKRKGRYGFSRLHNQTFNEFDDEEEAFGLTNGMMTANTVSSHPVISGEHDDTNYEEEDDSDSEDGIQ